MAQIVKSVLQGELRRVKALRKKYEEKIAQCPPGYLLERRRGQKRYYYLSYRDGDRIKQKFLGRLSKAEFKHYKEQMKLKKQLRQQLKETKQNIRYLERLLKK